MGVHLYRHQKQLQNAEHYSRAKWKDLPQQKLQRREFWLDKTEGKIIASRYVRLWLSQLHVNPTYVKSKGIFLYLQHLGWRGHYKKAQRKDHTTLHLDSIIDTKRDEEFCKLQLQSQ